ncbi:MAG: xylR 1 [Phycisphaerales bacterium]|nr:xylR 1 [Phycisphaerales bacterium]
MRTERAIGLAVDTIGSYGREVIQGVMTFCHLNPHWVIAVEPRFWAYYDRTEPENWEVDGLIIQAYSTELIERVHASGTPAINVSNMDSPLAKLPTIVPDDLAIGQMAGEYLLSLQYRHFGYCAHGIYEFSRLRGRAFHETIAAGGRHAAECDTATEDLAVWLTAQPKPLAVFCCNDAWAHRLLTICRKCKFRVPDQVAVLGVDDDELLNTVGALPMSSISIPAAKIGFEAARMLEAMLDGTPPPLHRTLPPLSVVARATTRMASEDHPEVSEALQFIRTNVGKLLRVDDVMEHLSISRRSLERRFQKALGRSVGSEIRRAHLERAKQLLTHTTLSIEDVAAASGFVNATMLGVHFRRFVGEAPTAFRKRSSLDTSSQGNRR